MAASVDFDYNGPPVTISNGMAIQLVEQFGVRNAWFALLKLRGMKLTNEKAESARETFAYFLKKVGHLRRMAKTSSESDGTLKEKIVGGDGDDEREKDAKVEGVTAVDSSTIETLLTADFDNFFSAPESLELREDLPQYPELEESEFPEGVGKDIATSSSFSVGTDGASAPINAVPTTVSLLQVIEQSKRQQQKRQQKQQQQKSSEISEQQAEDKGTTSEQASQQKIAAAAASESAVASNAKPHAEQKGEEVSSAALGKSTSSVAKNSRVNKKATTTDNLETKQVVEKLLVAKEEIAKRHAETIDDVVSVVMEKIRNNQPFEGELATPPRHFAPPKSHHKRSSGIAAGQRMVQRTNVTQKLKGGCESAEMLAFTQQQAQMSGGGSLTGMPPLASTASTPAFNQLPPGQSIVLLHNPAPMGGHFQIPSSQFAITTPSAAISPTTSSAHKQRSYIDPKMTIQPAAHLQQFSSTVGGTSIRSQQQQIYAIAQPILGEEGVGTATAIPLEMAIQQNMTVQELIQTLKIQGGRNAGGPIILQNNVSPSMIVPVNKLSTSRVSGDQSLQQETPDSSSQEAISIHDRSGGGREAIDLKKQGVVPSTSQFKKGRKRKSVGGEPAQKQNALPKTSTVEEARNKENSVREILQRMAPPLKGGEQEAKEDANNRILPVAQAKESKGGKKLPSKEGMGVGGPSVVSTAVSAVKADPKQQQRIEDLEAQLRKLNKQMATERNKSIAQKKRADKLQAELEKASDSIQLLKIDLACQKTDNNALIAENIALKAENQQLRSKGQRTVAVSVVQSPTSLAGKNRKRKEVGSEMEAEVKSEKGSDGRGRKLGANKKVESLPEKPETPPPLSSDLGRRQSKRICVARNQFMKNIF